MIYRHLKPKNSGVILIDCPHVIYYDPGNINYDGDMYWNGHSIILNIDKKEIKYNDKE